MVRRMATSRVRSRTAIAIVLAETSRIVNVTAAQIAAKNSLMFPKNARNERPNSFSDSLRVGYDEFSNIESIALEILGTRSGESVNTMKVPTISRDGESWESSSLRYS